MIFQTAAVGGQIDYGTKWSRRQLEIRTAGVNDVIGGAQLQPVAAGRRIGHRGAVEPEANCITVVVGNARGHGQGVGGVIDPGRG